MTSLFPLFVCVDLRGVDHSNYGSQLTKLLGRFSELPTIGNR